MPLGWEWLKASLCRGLSWLHWPPHQLCSGWQLWVSGPIVIGPLGPIAVRDLAVVTKEPKQWENLNVKFMRKTINITKCLGKEGHL